MRSLFLILSIFYTFSSIASEQVLTCGNIASEQSNLLVEACKSNPQNNSHTCDNELPDGDYMIPQFDIWLATNFQDYQMDFFTNGYLSLFGIEFTNFSATKPIFLNDQRLEIYFNVDINKIKEKNIRYSIAMDSMDLLNEGVGKVYFKGYLIQEGHSSDDISAIPYACIYQ